jgi:outer membrane protein TolC
LRIRQILKYIRQKGRQVLPFFVALCYSAAGECRPLTLSETITLAQQGSRSVASSANALSAQRYSLEAAHSEFDTRIVPSISVGAGGSSGGSGSTDYTAGVNFERKSTYGTKTTIGPALKKGNDAYVSGVGLNLTQPLLRGFGRDFNLDATYSAEAGVAGASRALYTAQLNAVLVAIATYYEAHRQDVAIGLNDDMAEKLRALASMAQAKEGVGLVSPMDSYRAEIRRKDAEDARSQSLQGKQESIDRLKLILGLPVSEAIELVPPPLDEVSVPTLDVCLKTAIDESVDLRQAKSELAEAERRTYVAKENTRPDVNLIFDYAREGSGDSVGKSTSFDQNRWGVHLQGSTDLYRTNQKAVYSQSLLAVSNARISLENRTEELSRQVRQQYDKLKQGQERIAIREAQIQQAEGKRALAQTKFTHGMADNFDLVEADGELLQARLNLLAAKVDYAVGVYVLKGFMGVLVAAVPQDDSSMMQSK